MYGVIDVYILASVAGEHNPDHPQIWFPYKKLSVPNMFQLLVQF